MKLILLDIDGTLVEAMSTLSDDMKTQLENIKKNHHDTIHLGIVGGSDRIKAEKQLGRDVLEEIMDVSFHENGAVFYKGSTLVCEDVLEDYVDPKVLRQLIDFILIKISQCNSPWKVGTFIERRKSALNISPIGRNCTHEQRKAFFEWDKVHKCREKLVGEIKEQFPDLPMELAIGGEISIDIHMKGFDKTRCLTHIDTGMYDEIHFIGDRMVKNGNDYELAMDPRVMAHPTLGPCQTQIILDKICRL